MICICVLEEISVRRVAMSDILWMCLELLANIYESYLCIHFMICSFDKKCRLVNCRVTHIIGIAVLTAIVSILNRITVYEGLLGLLYVAFFICFSLIFLSGSFLKKIFISILVNTVMIGTAALTANVLFALFKNDPTIIYTGHSLERILFMITGIGLFGYVLAILTKFTNKNNESLNAKEWALILSVLAISSLIIGAIHIVILNGDIDRSYINLLTVSELSIIFINILCLSITSSLNESHKREESLLLDKKRNEYSQRYAQSIKEQYDQTRRLRHDVKQYAASMAALIKDKKYDAAEEFAEKQAESLSSVETVVNVENDFINAILNTKLTLAKTKGIDIICSIERDISGIEDIDLCNLFGNLLDNAICAAEKCDLESRLVEVKISAIGSRVIILVKNSIPCSVLECNPELSSTKPISEEHGFGVKTIKSIAEKYNGKVDFYEEGLTFICLTELYREFVNLT